MVALVRLFLTGILFLLLTASSFSQDIFSRFLSDSIHSIAHAPPKRSWLKLDVVPLIRNIEDGQLSGIVGLIYEQKVGLGWSVLGEVHRYYRMSFSGSPTLDPNGPRMVIGLSTRFYPSAKRRITEGSQENNMVGSYLSAKVQSRLTNPYADQSRGITTSHWHTHQLAFSLLYGTQRQVWKIGFFDFSFGLQLAYGEPGYARFVFPSYIEEGWQIFPVGQIRFGLGT